MSWVDDTSWHHDPWDDADISDALVIERPRRQTRRVKWVV